jgi:Icc-related predicted phosphoesterase
LENDDTVLINVHGHCHDGNFHSKLKKEANSIIVNPGSLKFGQYGEVLLVKLANKW